MSDIWWLIISWLMIMSPSLCMCVIYCIYICVSTNEREDKEIYTPLLYKNNV